ncbi:MAG: DUF4265 domain-containing protein [Bacteroidia bacterium]
MNNVDKNLCKVYFYLPVHWHSGASESVWAEKLGEKNTFKIRNVPFYIRGIGLDDVVATVKENELNIFHKVVKPSGHSTYRIFLLPEITNSEFIKFWSPLEILGCTYEKADERLYAIDVPPNTDIFAVYKQLEEGEDKKIWEFEEGHCGHPV